MDLSKDAFPAVVVCLSRAEAYRDLGTNSHCRRVAQLLAGLAHFVGLDDTEGRRIAIAATLHDIGKFAVPIELLQKPTRLTPEEVTLIKVHTQAGYNILNASDDVMVGLAALICLCHHERYDGTGYPRGLVGADIPLPAQIVSICDIYDALREDRPYRRGMSHEAAMQILVNGDGRTSPSHFEPRVWRAFQSLGDQARSIFDSTVE
jgi:putative two-component system response regulator